MRIRIITPQGITDHGFVDRKIVHITAFGGRGPSGATPWHHHRVWLNTTSKILQDQVQHSGLATRSCARGTWQVESGYRDLLKSVEISEQVARAAEAAEVSVRAVLRGCQVRVSAAAHLRTSMIVPIIEDGRVVEDEIVDVDRMFTKATSMISMSPIFTTTVWTACLCTIRFIRGGLPIFATSSTLRTTSRLKVVVLEQNYRSTARFCRLRARSLLRTSCVRTRTSGRTTTRVSCHRARGV